MHKKNEEHGAVSVGGMKGSCGVSSIPTSPLETSELTEKRSLVICIDRINCPYVGQEKA